MFSVPGAFLIPYIIMIMFIGFPLLFMEYSFGQYFGVGSLSIFKQVCPVFEGGFPISHPFLYDSCMKHRTMMCLFEFIVSIKFDCSVMSRTWYSFFADIKVFYSIVKRNMAGRPSELIAW